MDIKILHSWLLEYLDTNASPDAIAKYMSLCGPSFEKVEKFGNDYLYSIEITSNRIDTAGVYGIAREASVILPEFKIKGNLKPIKTTSIPKSSKYKLNIKSNTKLTKRVIAVVLEGIEASQTPDWMKLRLEAAGMRSLNPIVDITNYVMLDIGHPTHVFDYDLIKDKSLVFRLADKNEQITSFDGKSYKLNGGEIVIDDGEGEIIDLPGIIGTKNSVVNKNTKKIVFFIDNNDPVRIRKASMALGLRTIAATINEKGVDPELGMVALENGVGLYQKICGAKVASKIYDLYDKQTKAAPISLTHEFIEKRLGISINSSRVTNILTRLGFVVEKSKASYRVFVPSFRQMDVEIPEDIVEEVARIYGYHSLPSTLMHGYLPDKPANSPFKFESMIKQKLKEFGGNEIYTLSLVPNSFAKNALKLKNPLGPDSEYLRTSLMSSLINAALANNREKEQFFLFEVANRYISRINDLPQEKMTLGVIFSNFDYRSAKGILESFLDSLQVKYTFKEDDAPNYLAGKALVIKSGKLELGRFGELESQNLIYTEIDIESLKSQSSSTPSYTPILKYPAQVEDLTITFPDKTKIGNVIEHIINSFSLVTNFELRDVYNDSYTFRIWYQNPNKTLTDEEVEEIRNKVLAEIKKKFAGVIKG